MKKVNNKGFSLVEILVAIAILGVLMTMAANAYNVYKKKARQQAYDTMAKSATTAASNYLMENAKEKFISFEMLKELDYIDTLQDPRYKEKECSGIVINKVIQGQEDRQIDILFQKVKLCCQNYKYQYDYTGNEVKVTEIEDCNYVDGDEIDGMYKLIYKPSGGTECVPGVILKKQNEKWGDLCVTTRENFAFKGWNTKKNGSGSIITKDTKVGDRDISAYAIWNEIFKLEYDEDGGSKCNPNFIKKENGEKWGDLCVTERDGYAFKGWRTKKDGEGTKITKNSFAEKNLTVYAHWNPYITITFDSQGGTACNPNSITKEKGEEWGKLCTPARDGYVFKGWNTKEDGTGTKVTSTTKATKNMTLYAIWNPKYTITYNSNGGKACDPGTLIQENGKEWGTLCAPTRTGYKFSGWKDQNNKSVTAETICKENLTLTAQWSAKTYTLTYDNAGGSGCTSKDAKYDSVWGDLCTPTKTGHNFSHWTDENGNTVNAMTICKGDKTVTANWTRKPYVLSYNDNGGSGCAGTTITKLYQDPWGTLCSPTKTGYTFSKWKNGSTEVTSSSKATENITVTAAWTANTYRITFNNNGGSGCTSQTSKYNSAWGDLCTPTKTGYSFTGWVDGSGAAVTATTVCKGDKSVTATWSANSYTLSYDNNGGDGCTSQRTKYDTAWGTLCTPTKTGHNFTKWTDTSGNTVTASTICKGNKTVKANWTKKNYTLSYNDNGGSGCSGNTITKPYQDAWGTLCTPTKTGYNFSGWKSGSTTVTNTSKATANITVTAQWTPKTYTLTYNNNGGSGCSSKTGSYNSTWGTLCTPTKTGYSFVKWKTSGGTEVTSSTTVTGNLSVTAEWSAKVYTLSYNSNGGTSCTSKSGTYGTTWGTLCSTSKTGHTFNGWYSGSTQITSGTTVTGNESVIASWTANTYTLSYDNNGGSGCSSKTGTYGSTWGTLCTPSRTGHTFAGWYSGSTKVTSSTTVSGDRSVKAQWSENSYTLTYNNNGGSGCSSKTSYYGYAWGTLCTPTRTGYTFTGWSDSSGSISSSTVCYGNRSVTANWSVNSYTLTYDNNGGSGCSSKSGTYGSTWGSLCTPTRAGHTFLGWYSGSTQVTSSTTITGNRTVTANWKANCPSGYTYQSNGTCVKTYTASSYYSCPSGGSLSGTTCTATSTYNASSYYSCPSGGSLSGTTCYTSSNYAASVSYSCPSGGSLSGSTCYTSSSYTPSVSYSCPYGGSLSGTTCSSSSSYSATKTTTYSNCEWDRDGGHFSSTRDNNSDAVWQRDVSCSPSNVGETRKMLDCGKGKKSCYNGRTYDCNDESCYSPSKKGWSYKNATCTCSSSTSYTCPSGGTLSGTTCYTSSSYDASPSYSCYSGGSLSGAYCVINSSYAASASYSCNSGDSRSGSTCTKSSSYNATKNYSCNSGDSRNGTTCTTTSTYTATKNYSCNSGDSRNGTTCTSVVYP